MIWFLFFLWCTGIGIVFGVMWATIHHPATAKFLTWWANRLEDRMKVKTIGGAEEVIEAAKAWVECGEAVDALVAEGNDGPEWMSAHKAYDEAGEALALSLYETNKGRETPTTDQTEPMAEKPDKCILCGHWMEFSSCGSAAITVPEGSLCHADDHSCYEKWTVYGERPLYEANKEKEKR